ncbi:VOC family protein [Georgenia sp. TF02-10]|uniref:VOC family protein n=1 Tax=Georgenia sp. TF02-10 TaxID=2917725 RepID=UPI001FA6AB26|nr:VOC family protein [Georgenia sp. TF02-10]UNX55026.1 VOC family protein [Georgenia sp. TF02-10]
MTGTARATRTGELAFFELGVADAERGRRFYAELFGWTFTPGPSGGEGGMITTPNVPGGIHGGDPGASPYVFFAVEDIERAVAKVRELGGSVDDADVEGDEESQATYGRFKLCRDDQGSPFGLYQAPAAR